MLLQGAECGTNYQLRPKKAIRMMQDSHTLPLPLPLLRREAQRRVMSPFLCGSPFRVVVCGCFTVLHYVLQLHATRNCSDCLLYTSPSPRDRG